MLKRELLIAAALSIVSSGAFAQDTVKIGLILPMTGQQASTGKQIDAAVKLYQQQPFQPQLCRQQPSQQRLCQQQPCLQRLCQ